MTVRVDSDYDRPSFELAGAVESELAVLVGVENRVLATIDEKSDRSVGNRAGIGPIAYRSCQYHAVRPCRLSRPSSTS